MRSEFGVAARAGILPLALFELLLSGSGCNRSATPRSVVLLTIDTLRADQLGCYGGPVATPHLDRIGREGFRATSTFAPIPRTTGSVGSILTGLHPLKHGADGLGMALPAEAHTLAERFHAAGFETAAFVSNVALKPGLGFERGFDLFSNPTGRWGEADSAQGIVGEATAWLGAKGRGERPFFLWLHLLDPHWTYQPADPHASDPDWEGPPFKTFEQVASGALSKGQVVFEADRRLSERERLHMQRLYRGEIAESDASVGRLLESLANLKLLDEVVLVFASDHGESLGEHRYWYAHGEYLYDSTLHVPWMIRAPRKIPAGTVLTGTTAVEDISPTTLALAGVPLGAAVDGRDLSALITPGGQVEAPPEALIHLTDHLLIHPENPRREVSGRAGRWWALRKTPWKLILIPRQDGSETAELYDLSRDPDELNNLAAVESARLATMAAELKSRRADLLAAFPTTEDGAYDPQDRETLRSLGYVGK